LSAFTCYFDASGTQHDQVALAVAGFMATADSWLDFEKEWLTRLRKSKLDYFHRKEITVERYPGLLEDLARIIQGHAMRKFGMVVRVEALHRLVAKSVYKQWHLDAYGYAGRACAAHVRMWAKQHHQRTMPELVFAKGDTGKEDLEKGLKLDGFSNYTFRPAKDEINRKTGLVDKAAIPLQAADLFAYELFYPVRRIEQTGPRMGRHELTPVWFILDKVPGEPQVTENASLVNFEERMKQFLGAGGSGVIGSKWMPR
jgi:hypothetical protein